MRNLRSGKVFWIWFESEIGRSFPQGHRSMLRYAIVSRRLELAPVAERRTDKVDVVNSSTHFPNISSFNFRKEHLFNYVPTPLQATGSSLAPNPNWIKEHMRQHLRSLSSSRN